MEINGRHMGTSSVSRGLARHRMAMNKGAKEASDKAGKPEMPGGDGDRVVKLVKGDESLKNIKIMVFTGYPGEGRKLLRMGADSMVEKCGPGSESPAFRKEICRLLGVDKIKVGTGVI